MTRLLPIIRTLVHQNQVGFVVVGRLGLRLKLELYKFDIVGRTLSQPISVSILDTEKGFDEIYWGYLDAVLKQF